MKVITRRELEALGNQHLAPALEALASQGVVVAIVMAPRQDPADGRAVVSGNCASVAEMISAFEQAIRELKKGGYFVMQENVS